MGKPQLQNFKVEFERSLKKEKEKKKLVKMAAAIGLAKTATEVFLGVGTVSIDNLTFQLHYRWSVTLFVVCSVLVQTSQFFGDPVQCETVSGFF